MTDGSRNTFEWMKPGDDVLITERGTGYFTHYGQVIGKTENRELGNRIWPIVHDNPWELIYFLRSVRRIHVPKREFLVALGYTDPKDQLPGARRVRSQGLADFIAAHGPIVEWLEVPTEDLPIMTLDRDEEFTGDDFLSQAKRRKGQQIFAQRVKENYGGSCAICGITEGRFLVAGHIVGWAEDKAHRLNPANGICLCVFHDRAFEAGYISLDERLRVTVSPRLSKASALGKLLHAIENRVLRKPTRCPPDERFLAQHRKRLLK
jgi:predicted restriction endonuclease